MNIAKAKVYLSVAGAIGLAVFQISAGQYEQAVQTVLAGVGALGIFHGVKSALGR